MNTMDNTITVTILDKEYSIKYPEGKHEELEAAAQLLDQKMRDTRNTTEIIGVERIAIMTALNMAYELIQTKKDNHQYINHMGNRIKSLQEKMDSTLTNADEI